MDNRDNIMECALELFYQRGYDAVGIQEICQAAGVTKPTLYHYFGSKRGLLETLVETRLGSFMEKLECAAQFRGDVQQSLYDFATVLIDSANANRRDYLLLMNLCFSAKENETYQVAEPYARKIYALAVQLFEQAAVQLGNMNGRQKQFAIGFVGLLNQYMMYLWYEDDSEEPISEGTKRSLIHQFVHGITS